MKKMIASALAAALILGSFTTSAQAAAPLAKPEQAVENNRRPNYGPAGHRPQPPQPGRPGGPSANRPQANHRPPAPQPSHRPQPQRPGHSYNSSKNGLGLGLIIGAVVGSVIAGSR